MHFPFDFSASILSPAGSRGRLSILIYHRVRDAKDPLLPGEIDRTTFDWQVSLLMKHFNVLPLSEACERLRRGQLPARAACITFDDGYADNESIALPILQRHGATATFFVATEFLDGGRMWNDTVIEWVRHVDAAKSVNLSDFGIGTLAFDSIEKRKQVLPQIISKIKYLEPDLRAERVQSLLDRMPVTLPNDLMMTSEQVRNLRRAGMGIGGHTNSHPILASLSDADAQREIAIGKERLEKIIDEPVRLFAYPNGKPKSDYGCRDRDIVKALGFEAAVSTQWGAGRGDTDPFQLPRFTPWQATPSRFHAALVLNLRRKIPEHCSAVSNSA